jgi:hypothetical protein
MSDEEKQQHNKEHYICLGGCHGVSDKPGVCQTPGCAHEGHALVPCNCTDGKHNNFEPKNKPENK